MAALLNWRVWVAVALAAGLTFSHFTVYRAGKATVMAAWTAAKLDESEAKRLREKSATIANQGVDNANQKQKVADAAASRAVAGRVRDLQAALELAANYNPAAACGSDGDPRDCIIAQCSDAVGRLDQAVKSFSRQTGGLQRYAREVCIGK